MRGPLFSTPSNRDPKHRPKGTYECSERMREGRNVDGDSHGESDAGKPRGNNRHRLFRRGDPQGCFLGRICLIRKLLAL